ncbi:MAG: hypothetical protein ACRC62_15265 [Microcoleus sp.]
MLADSFRGDNPELDISKILPFSLDPEGDRRNQKTLKIIKAFIDSNPPDLPSGFLTVALPLLQDNGMLG